MGQSCCAREWRLPWDGAFNDQDNGAAQYLARRVGLAHLAETPFPEYGCVLVRPLDGAWPVQRPLIQVLAQLGHVQKQGICSTDLGLVERDAFGFLPLFTDLVLQQAGLPS